MFAARLAAITGGLIVCVPLHYLSLLIFRRSLWPRRFLWWVGFAAGMRVRVEGRPLRSHVLFLSNHVSWLDIMVVAGATGAAFVSRDDVARWPMIGWLAKLNDTIFVDRSGRRAVKGQADALRTALSSGRPVALFPEGTTEGGHEVLPFRASLLASLFPPLDQVQVQPLAIDYGEAVHDIAWVDDEAAGANAKRVLSRAQSTTVRLRFLDPVDPHIYGDRKSLAAKTREEIVEALTAFDSGGDPLYGRR
jgi:lyso-ornithine lipid O-acyltransferase